MSQGWWFVVIWERKKERNEPLYSNRNACQSSHPSGWKTVGSTPILIQPRLSSSTDSHTLSPFLLSSVACQTDSSLLFVSKPADKEQLESLVPSPLEGNAVAFPPSASRVTALEFLQAHGWTGVHDVLGSNGSAARQSCFRWDRKVYRNS